MRIPVLLHAVSAAVDLQPEAARVEQSRISTACSTAVAAIRIGFGACEPPVVVVATEVHYWH